jgi:glycosyltransferase involved in cell wall biosynthesis
MMADISAPPAPAQSTERLKLLIVAFSARNAIEQTIDELAGGLMPFTDCRVMVPTNYRGSLPEASLLRVRLGFTKVGGLLAGINPLAHGQVLAAVWRFRPDVIHMLSGEGYPWAATLVAAARLGRIPMVLTMNDPDPHPGNLFETMNAALRRPVLRTAAVFHLYSNNHDARMKQLVPSARTMVIEHGSLAGRFLRHRQDGIARERLVLFFGRIQYYKGIDVLCRAVQQMDGGVRLAIAGPGTIGADDQGLIAALGARVELHNGFVDDAAVAHLMQRAAVVALPYRHATQSSVPGIATAFEVPMVASALGHFVQEVPALGGLLVPPEDPAALAAALGRALDGELTPAAPVPTFAELAPDYLAVYAAAGARPGRRSRER